MNYSELVNEVIAENGIVGLAVSLARLEAESIRREWGDFQLMIDMMDDVGDIRTAQGKYAGTPLNKRFEELLKDKNIAILLAKRKIPETTQKRLFDSKKIQAVDELHVSEKDLIMQDLRRTFSQITGRSKR